MNYDIWPGIGLSEAPVEWSKALGSAALSTKSTANVERRREQGSDFSTFKGISKRSDEMNARGAPSRMRRTAQKGRTPGSHLNADSKSGKIRTALQHGPMTRAEICAAVGVHAKCISAYLLNDVKQGRIRKIVKEGQLQKFALAEAA